MSYTRIIARGRGAFPVDMLRFLQAWPATDQDAVAIASSFGLLDPRVEHAVTLETALGTSSALGIHPHLLRRFESFGWNGEVATDLPPMRITSVTSGGVTREVPDTPENRAAVAPRGWDKIEGGTDDPLTALRALVAWVDATGVTSFPALAGMDTVPLDDARRLARLEKPADRVPPLGPQIAEAAAAVANNIAEVHRRACDVLEGLEGMDLPGAMPARVAKLREALYDPRVPGTRQRLDQGR